METRRLAAKPLSCSLYFSVGADKGDTLPRIKAFVIHSDLRIPPSTAKIKIPAALTRPPSILTSDLSVVRIHGSFICTSACLSFSLSLCISLTDDNQVEIRKRNSRLGELHGLAPDFVMQCQDVLIDKRTLGREKGRGFLCVTLAINPRWNLEHSGQESNLHAVYFFSAHYENRPSPRSLTFPNTKQ